MSLLKTVLIQNVEKWLQENLKDLPVDNISSTFPTEFFANGNVAVMDDCEFDFKVEIFTPAQQVEALQKLADEIDGEKLFVGGLKSSAELVDPCNWDVEVTDAYFQLLYHGEVIYG